MKIRNIRVSHVNDIWSPRRVQHIKTNVKQDCFLQKEARVCVSNAFVIEDSKFKWCFVVVEDEQVTEEADMLMWI